MADPQVPVPPHRQETDYTCGPACLRAVLEHFGTIRTEAQLARELPATARDGTLPRDLVRVARSYGLSAGAHLGLGKTRLKKALDRGHPVIIAIQAWAARSRPNYKNTDDNGHYVVVVGYDRRGIRILDPVPGGYLRMSWARLANRWHDRDGEDERYEQLGIVIGKKRKR